MMIMPTPQWQAPRLPAGPWQASRPAPFTRATRLFLAGLALAVAWNTAAPVAHAMPDDPPGVKHIALRWDGPTTALDWQGGTYAYAKSNFVGSPVSVPGDMAKRTAIVRNDGPSDATAKVVITATTTNAAETVNTELEKLIHMFWNVNGHTGDKPWAQVRKNGFQVSFPVAKGQEFPITVGYRFPWEATGGQNKGATSSVLSFDVGVMLEGDVSTVKPPVKPPVTPPVEPPVIPTAPPVKPTATPSPKGPVPQTGGMVIGPPVILVATLLIGSSVVAAFFYLRREDENTPTKEL